MYLNKVNYIRPDSLVKLHWQWILLFSYSVIVTLCSRENIIATFCDDSIVHSSHTYPVFR